MKANFIMWMIIRLSMVGTVIYGIAKHTTPLIVIPAIGITVIVLGIDVENLKKK